MLNYSKNLHIYDLVTIDSVVWIQILRLTSNALKQKKKQSFKAMFSKIEIKKTVQRKTTMIKVYVLHFVI